MITLLVISKSSLGLKVSVRRLICQLCVLDVLCITFNIMMFSGPWPSEHYRHQVRSHRESECHLLSQILPLLMPVLLGLTQMSLTGSVFTILAVAIERLLAVRRYLKYTRIIL